MSYDPNVPHLLKREQQWFGSIIGQPIDEDSRMNPISPSGNPIEIEAAEHIAPSPTLRTAQRIQIYNHHYWWRLLNTLQDSYPLVTRLFGYYDFNRTIAIPYLLKYPPNHWSLNNLGDHLAEWVKETYHGDDKKLVYDAAILDWAFNKSFIEKELPPLSAAQISTESQMEEILDQPLFTQPHIHLFQMDHHLFNFRNTFLNEKPDYWVENDFPELERNKTFFFVLYRNIRQELSWKDLTAGEYHLLSFFQTGISINAACDWLEKQNAALYDAAMENLHLWFQEWTQRGWLYVPTKTKIF